MMVSRFVKITGCLVALVAAGVSGCALAADAPAPLTCPTTLDAAYRVPVGARLVGAAPKGTVVLTHASLATGTPADQDPAALAEFEQDDEVTKDGVTTYTYYYETTTQSPLSVICGYGDPHGAKQPVLLLPVPSGTKGDCKFRTPVVGNKSGTPSTMVCSWH